MDMGRYYNGKQPHVGMAKIEAEIAFLPGPPEKASAIAKNFTSRDDKSKA